MHIFRIFLILVIAQLSQTAFAGDKLAADSKSSKTTITKIKSDFIDIRRNDEVINLNSHVIIEREDLNVLADHMQVYYDQNKKDGSNKIKKILANDHVKIFNGEFVATGDTGFYDPAQDNFILENNVIFNRGSSVAHGEKFIYDLKTRKGNLVGEKIADKEKNQEAGKDGRVVVIIDDSDAKSSKKIK